MKKRTARKLDGVQDVTSIDEAVHEAAACCSTPGNAGGRTHMGSDQCFHGDAREPNRNMPVVGDRHMDERLMKKCVSQPVPEWDLAHRLPIDRVVGPDIWDTGMVFRLKSTYMDITEPSFLEKNRELSAAVRRSTHNHQRNHGHTTIRGNE